jgi:hypothetical protein
MVAGVAARHHPALGEDLDGSRERVRECGVRDVARVREHHEEGDEVLLLLGVEAEAAALRMSGSRLGECTPPEP